MARVEPLPPPPTDYAAHSWHDAPAAPLDIIPWLDQRDVAGPRPFDDRQYPPPEPVARPVELAPTHRLVGPASLDAELRAVDPLVRGCYRASAAMRAATPRMKITLQERPGLPIRVISVDPSDAPIGLVGCVTDALTGELVRPLGSKDFMVVVTGPT